MSSALYEALAFFKDWGGTKVSMVEAMRRRFTPATVWENVGLSRTTGFEEALEFVRGFERHSPFEGVDVIVHHACADGDTVLTERTDKFFASDGQLVLSVRLMGALTMDGPRIVAWRDYFNPGR